MKLAVSPIHPGRAITACDLCGTRFLSWISQDQRYCSRRCFDRVRHIEAFCMRDCERCGQPFEIARRSKQRFCSLSCSSAAIYTGEARHVTHGGSRTPEYRIWHYMKRRCENPANKGYPHYGGRGIAVCKRWQDFAAFYRDMGPRPGPTFTIERKDVNQGYDKDNCVWIEARYQARNTTRNRLLMLDGRTQTMFEWAREIGISPAGLCTRLNRQGMVVEEALTKPVKPSRSTQTHLLTYQGKTQTLAAWAREMGLNHQTLSARLKKGWGVERALATPVGGRS